MGVPVLGVGENVKGCLGPVGWPSGCGQVSVCGYWEQPKGAFWFC